MSSYCFPESEAKGSRLVDLKRAKPHGSRRTDSSDTDSSDTDSSDTDTFHTELRGFVTLRLSMQTLSPLHAPKRYYLTVGPSLQCRTEPATLPVDPGRSRWTPVDPVNALHEFC